jgi:hypothetical protein
MRFGDFEKIYGICCDLTNETEPDNADPGVAYSPLSVPLSSWLLIGLLVPAGLLWWFTPHLARPLPYDDPQGLYVTQNSVAFVGKEELAGKEETEFSFSRWREYNTAFSELAGFAPMTVQSQHPLAGERELSGLAVSRNFFRVFSTRPMLGEAFSGQDGLNAMPAVVLSHGLWKRLGADPAILGKNLVFNRRPVKVVAVMPEEFWFLSVEPGFWLTLDFAEIQPPRLRAVGRLHAGVTPVEMLRELREIAGEGVNVGLGGHIVSLPELIHRNFRAALAMMLIPLTVTLALGFLQIMSLRRLVAPGRLKGTVVLRYYAFLLSKSALALLPVAAVWVVLTEWAFPAGPRWLAMGVRPTATLVFLMLCATMIWWSLVDQRLRCPSCFRRLRMPVSLGRFGSILFDLPATEYICTHGHGTLHVPEPRTNELEPTRWRPHGDVWEELLAAKK